MSILFNVEGLKSRRQYLRNHQTTAECYLWQYLRRRQILGLKFRRQFSIGKYVVDFYCPEIHFSIELDGNYHDTPSQQEYDAKRSSELAQLGIVELRFRNERVFDDVKSVIIEIEDTARNLMLSHGINCAKRETFKSKS
jgi:very-short-patch-repair endonuclease